MSGRLAAQYRPLGAFRFGLALLVVLQHFQHLLPAADRAMFSHMGFGALAVCVFFAVSGFVVAEVNAVFYARRPGAFLANRALRLVPPYGVALCVSVLVQGVLWHAGRLVLWDFSLSASPLAAETLLSGVLGLLPGFNPRWFGQDFEFIPFVWTLRMEIAFYLVAAGTMAMSWRVRSTWPVWAALVAGLAASAAFLLLAGRPGALNTAPMFLIGVCVFLLEARRSGARAVLLLAAAGLAAAGFVSWRQHGAPVLAWQMPALGGLMALFVWLVTRRAAGRGRMIDRRLGDWSYPLYLNHYVVGVVATSLAPRMGVAVYLGAVVLSVGLAVAAERLVDRPLRGWRDRVRAVVV
jgi:peptidoglycan/LPS O-acetylase OafA/YrhL